MQKFNRVCFFTGKTFNINDFRKQKVNPAKALKTKLHHYEDIDEKFRLYEDANKKFQLCKSIENKYKSYENLDTKFRPYDCLEKKVIMRKDNFRVSLKNSIFRYSYNFLSFKFFISYA